jgi:hypothetical protein
MNGLATLAALNAAETKRYYNKRKPALLRSTDDVRHAPDYSGGDMDEVARHFRVKKHEEYFVDSSGFGSPGEPAMSFELLSRKIADLLAQYPERKWYAVLSGIGQFQAYVTLFYKKVQRKAT